MKKKICSLLISFFCLSAVGLFGFDSFMGSSGSMEDFFGSGGMDFGTIDFGDDDDPFAKMFGGSSMDDSSEDASPFGDTGGASYDYLDSQEDDMGRGFTTKEKATTPEVATSLEEAFKNGIKPEVKKLTPQYKQAIAFYLNAVSTQLKTLITHFSSYVLGIKLKQELRPSGATASEVLLYVDKIRTSSLYHIALMQKEFDTLRHNLIDAIPAIEKVNTQFITLAKEIPDTLDAPKKAEIQKQKNLFTQAKALVANTIKPLIQDKSILKAKVKDKAKGKEEKPVLSGLKAVAEHKSIKDRLAAKKKKYAPRIAGSRASAAGGWSAGARDYFDDNYGSGGYSGYSNRGYSSGGYSWDDGDYGGANYNSGGYGDSYSSSYGGGSGNSYGDSSSKKSSSSPAGGTSSSMRRTGNIGGSYFTDDYTSSVPGSEKKSGGTYQGVKQRDELFTDTTPKDQVLNLLKTLPAKILKWHTRYESAKTPALKNIEIKTILGDSSFTTDVERLTRLMELYPEVKSELSTHQRKLYESFYKNLLTYTPVLVHAITYASPPFSMLFEERAAVVKKGLSAEEAKLLAEKEQKQRVRSYGILTRWFELVRNERIEDKEAKKLFEHITDELLKHAQHVLEKTGRFVKELNNDTILSFEDIRKLDALSRQLYHEPVAVGYAVVDDEDTESSTLLRKERITALRTEKESVAKLVVPVVEKQFALAHEMVTLLQEASDGLAQPLSFEEPATVHAFSEKLSQLLASSEGGHPHKKLLQETLLPCEQKKYQHLEIQHGLLLELVRMWSPKALPEELREEND